MLQRPTIWQALLAARINNNKKNNNKKKNKKKNTKIQNTHKTDAQTYVNWPSKYAGNRGFTRFQKIKTLSYTLFATVKVFLLEYNIIRFKQYE